MFSFFFFNICEHPFHIILMWYNNGDSIRTWQTRGITHVAVVVKLRHWVFGEVSDFRIVGFCQFSCPLPTQTNTSSGHTAHKNLLLHFPLSSSLVGVAAEPPKTTQLTQVGEGEIPQSLSGCRLSQKHQLWMCSSSVYSWTLKRAPLKWELTQQWLAARSLALWTPFSSSTAT